jgi:hypothetical protein
LSIYKEYDKAMSGMEGMGFVSLAAGQGYIYFIFQLSLFSADKSAQRYVKQI